MNHILVLLAFLVLNLPTLSAQTLERFSFVVSPDIAGDSKAYGVFLLSSKEDASFRLEMNFLNSQTNEISADSRAFSGNLRAGELTNLFWNGRDFKDSTIDLGMFLKVRLMITSKNDSENPEVLNYILPFKYYLDSDQDEVLNYMDEDADNDGISGLQEYFNNNPYADLDEDSIPNYVDVDFVSNKNQLFVDRNRDGVNDLFDSDGDGILND